MRFEQRGEVFAEKGSEREDGGGAGGGGREARQHYTRERTREEKKSRLHLGRGEYRCRVERGREGGKARQLEHGNKGVRDRHSTDRDGERRKFEREQHGEPKDGNIFRIRAVGGHT